MSGPSLAFRGVSVRYEPAAPPVLADVTFSVAPGERVGLLGLNGSGKTTLLAATVGLVPHEGEIQVDGERVARRNLSRIRDRIGFLFNVPEDQLLFPKVIEDVAFGLMRRGAGSAAAMNRAREVLASLGVADLAEWPAHHLSHGQKQRVALAGALVTDPRLLLLDEPSAGLDPPGRNALADLLGGVPAAMVIATHDLDFASRLCTRYLLLDRGRIVFDGDDVKAARERWDV